MKQSDDYLRALTVMGVVLMWTPITVGLANFAVSATTGCDVFSDSSGGEMYTTALFLASGLTILVYVGIRRFRQGLRGELGSEKGRGEAKE